MVCFLNIIEPLSCQSPPYSALEVPIWWCQTRASWGSCRGAPEPQRRVPPVLVLLKRFASQVCDDGATAKEAVRDLGHTDLRVRPTGGASFTNYYRTHRFLPLLYDAWTEGSYNSVTLLWAGNDLTGRWAADFESLQAAVAELKSCCERWGLPLRLFDLVGGTYLK